MIGGRSLASVPCPVRWFARRRGGSRGSRGGGAVFPPHADSVHRPQRRCHASRRSVPCRSGWLEYAAVGSGAVSVTAPAHGRGGLWAHPWHSRGAAIPGWPVVAASFRRRYPSAASSSHRRPDSGRPENALGHGTCAVRSADSVGRSTHAGGGAVPATSGKCCHPGARRSGSQSCRHDTTSSTVATHEPKGSDVFGVVVHNHRCFKVLLGQIPLVLRLQVRAIGDGKLERFPRAL